MKCENTDFFNGAEIYAELKTELLKAVTKIYRNYDDSTNWSFKDVCRVKPSVFSYRCASSILQTGGTNKQAKKY